MAIENRATIAELIGLLHEQSPAGFAVALHVRFSSPTFLFQSYPPEWSEIYTAKGLLMQDPTVAWGFTQLGAVRWSALAGEDPAGVFELAREHGLAYGVALAMKTGDSRSLASFARGDREFSDAEIAAIVPILHQLHEITTGAERLSEDDRAALTAMSVRLTHP